MPSSGVYQPFPDDSDDGYEEAPAEEPGSSGTPWIIVNSKYEHNTLEIKMFSSYGRMMTITGLFAFATLLAYWTLSIFIAIMIRRYHTAMAFVAFSSLLVLLLVGYACCMMAWLEAMSVERLTLDASGARIEHITPLRSFVAKMTGGTPRCSRRVVLHSRSLQAEVITYPIRSLTGLEEATALEIAPGVRFSNWYLEDEQLHALAAGINLFLQSVGHRRALGGAAATVMERPAPSRMRLDYKDKDRVHFSVSPSLWALGVLLLFSYEMVMGCIGVLYSFAYTVSDHRVDHLIVACPLFLLSLLFLAITGGFTFMLFSSLATDIIEVDKEQVNVRKSHWLPCGGWTDSVMNGPSTTHEVRLGTSTGLGGQVGLVFDEGTPALRVHSQLVAHGGALDDLAWMKCEVDALLAVLNNTSQQV